MTHTATMTAPTMDYSTLLNTHGQHKHVLTLHHHKKEQQQQQQQRPKPSTCRQHEDLHEQQQREDKDNQEILPSPDRQINRKSVAFNDTVTIEETCSYSDEEIEAAWYSPRELEDILRSVHDLLLTYLYLAATGQKNDGLRRKLCVRGLESSSGESLKMKHMRRQRQSHSISIVQKTMDKASPADVEIMAYMSRRLSFGAVKEAIQRAQVDYEASRIANQ